LFWHLIVALALFITEHLVNIQQTIVKILILKSFLRVARRLITNQWIAFLILKLKNFST
jgi:hypothetical protein